GRWPGHGRTGPTTKRTAAGPPQRAAVAWLACPGRPGGPGPAYRRRYELRRRPPTGTVRPDGWDVSVPAHASPDRPRFGETNTLSLPPPGQGRPATRSRPDARFRAGGGRPGPAIPRGSAGSRRIGDAALYALAVGSCR